MDGTPRKLGRKEGELQEFESLWLLLLFFKLLKTDLWTFATSALFL